VANWVRKVAMAAAMAAGTLASSSGAAAQVTPGVGSDPNAHLRPTTPAVASLVGRAMEASATFRGIVEAIEASDTYVYVMEGDCGHGVRACFWGVTIAGPLRIMRVTVALDGGKPDWYVMGSIGHELYHTVEAIQHPSVRSTEAQYLLYERIGFRGTTHSHETLKAMDAGNAVRAEIRKFSRSSRPE
jgi:hypothetical protein